MRRTGDGRYPVPGWSSDYEWDGLIPFEDLPPLRTRPLPAEHVLRLGES